MPSVDVRYQSLEAPLNEKAVRALAELQRSYAADRKLQDNIRSASNILAETASAINEAKVERREKHSRHNKRLQENGEDLNDDSEVKAFEARVDDVTEKMDHAIRRIIDDRVWMESISDTLRHVGNKSSNATATQTQRSQRSTQLPTQDATPRQHDLANEDYGNEDVLNSDGNDEEDTTASGPPPPEEAPTTLLRVALSSHKVRHASKTLTERYAHDNDYAGFYKSIHDARHAHLPNPPPVPNAALWFGREEGRLTASLSADGFPEEDTELGVVGERTSVKCPLTLQYFKDPVTSDVCHHSLEKSAILDMLKVSTDFVPFTPEQEIELSRLKDGQRARRERQIRTPRVHCPECNRWMQEADLRANPVLQRRAKRIMEKEKRDEEEQQDEDDEAGSDADREGGIRGIRGTQRRPFGVGSSPLGRNSSSGVSRVKQEMMDRKNQGRQNSSAPGGSAGEPRRGTQIVDMEDSSDED